MVKSQKWLKSAMLVDKLKISISSPRITDEKQFKHLTREYKFHHDREPEYSYDDVLVCLFMAAEAGEL